MRITVLLSMAGRRLRALTDKNAQIAYSQEGEDLLLRRYFEGRTLGFYVDVGAHHPSRFSNTRLLFEQGWRGINIDPLPGSEILFNRHRPRDVNLEIGVSRSHGFATFYQFDEPALSTFSEEVATQRRAMGWSILAQHKVTTVPLTSILDEHAQGTEIEFLNVDVEGRDLDVLQSLDFTRYRPEVICAESLLDSTESDIEKFLALQGYRFLARTINSLFYVADDASATATPNSRRFG